MSEHRLTPLDYIYMPLAFICWRLWTLWENRR